MTYTVIINAILVGLILWLTHKTWNRQKHLNHLLKTLTSDFGHISDYLTKKQKTDEKMTNVISSTVNALNDSFARQAEYMNNMYFSIQTMAACMISVVDRIKHQAVADENFEKAQECAKLIAYLKNICNGEFNQEQ